MGITLFPDRQFCVIRKNRHGPIRKSIAVCIRRIPVRQDTGAMWTRQDLTSHGSGAYRAAEILTKFFQVEPAGNRQPCDLSNHTDVWRSLSSPESCSSHRHNRLKTQPRPDFTGFSKRRGSAGCARILCTPRHWVTIAGPMCRCRHVINPRRRHGKL